MAEECRLVISKEIQMAGCFSALIDESKDLAKREELAFSVRYCQDGNVNERFLHLVMLTKFDVKSIMKVTKTLIDKVLQNSDIVPVISDTLVRVINDDKGSYNPKHVDTASGIYHKLLSGKFIISLTALHSYLRELFYLNKEL